MSEPARTIVSLAVLVPCAQRKVRLPDVLETEILPLKLVTKKLFAPPSTVVSPAPDVAGTTTNYDAPLPVTPA